MTAATVTRAPLKRPGSASTRRPALTAVVCGVTLAVSIAALASPALMRLFNRAPSRCTSPGTPAIPVAVPLLRWPP